MRSRYRDLVAYQRARRVAAEVHRAVAVWPKFERWSLGLQLVEAADSISANIAEAAGRWHSPDRRRLLLIARGSLYETEHWLSVAQERQLHLPDTTADLDEAARTLQGLIDRHAPH